MVWRARKLQGAGVGAAALILVTGVSLTPVAVAAAPPGPPEAVTSEPLRPEEPATPEERKAQVALDDALYLMGIEDSVDQETYDALLQDVLDVGGRRSTQDPDVVEGLLEAMHSNAPHLALHGFQAAAW